MSGTTRDMRARLVLSLRDGAASGLDRTNSRLDRIRQTLGRLAAVTVLGAGLNFLGPMQQAAQFDDTLRQTAITAGRSGAEVEAYIRRTQAAYEGLAVTVGQRSRDIATAAAGLVAAGMAEDQVLPAMQLISRVATASGSSMDELGRTYFQLQQQLGITTAQMPQAFAVLITGAKAGNFELRDMAREFPAILAAARALRIEGLGGAASLTAMLQVARTAAGSSSEAANNVLNALQKLASPETVRQFREIGVNIEGLMNDAVRRGINPIEAVVQRLRERTGGNLFRMQELFGDRQALMGLLPLLQQTARYLEIRDEAAGSSPGVIDDDLASRLRGMLAQMTIVEERVEQLSRRFQLGLAPALLSINSALAGLQDGLAWIDREFPGLGDAVISLASSVMLGVVALGLLGQVGLLIFRGLQPLIWLFGALATAVGTPVAIAIAAVVGLGGAALLLWRNWDRVGPWFRRLWQIIQGLFRDFVAWVQGWGPGAWGAAVSALQAVWGVLRIWFNTLWQTWVVAPFNWFIRWVDGWTDGAATASLGRLQRLWESPREFIAEMWTDVQRRFDEFVGWIDQWTGGALTDAINRFKAVWDALRPFFQGLWNGIKATFDLIFGPIIAVIERIDAIIARNRSEAASETGAVNDPEAQAARRQNWRQGRTGAEGFYAPQAAMPGGGRVTGEITLRALPGTQIEDARMTEGGVALTAPDRGGTRSRP